MVRRARQQVCEEGQAAGYGILRTRLQRPPVAPDILPRARLLDRLNEGCHRTLTLVSAPAGYGKTTLASRWVAVCDCFSGSAIVAGWFLPPEAIIRKGRRPGERKQVGHFLSKGETV